MFTNRSISRIVSVLFNAITILSLMVGSGAFPTNVQAAVTNRYVAPAPVDNPLAGGFQNMLLQVSGSWLSLGTGLNATVYAIAISGSDVYAGGNFTDAGGDANADRIAKFSGGTWSALGAGLNGPVYAIAINGSDVYAAGDFTDAGGDANADRIAKFSGGTWSALGTGLNGTVYAITINASDVYAAGDFADAGGDANADRIAKFSGGTWSALGTGLNASVHAIAISGGDVYAGGNFTDAGGDVSADRIARFSSGTWSALGTGLNASVHAIAISGGDVYAGGDFTDAGGDANADLIAKWNGTEWSPLGTGLEAEFWGTVLTIAVSGSGDVYAGGAFSGGCGQAMLIATAKFSGGSWSALGADLPNVVRAFALDGSKVFAGGDFTGSCENLPDVVHIAKFTPVLANQTITVTTHAPGSAINGSNFTVAAIASSGLPVSYTSLGSCTNVGPDFTMTSDTGNCTVMYDQAGDANYNPAPQKIEVVAAQAVLVNQTISVTTHAPVSAVYGSSFTVAATASSGLPVSYSSSGACTNAGADFTMISDTGDCTVKYDQAGDANHNPAPQVTEVVTAQALLVGPLYVKWNAIGANNGTSWDDAYTDLQSALSAALSGDEIWVAAGTYHPTSGGDRTATFTLKNDVGIYGGFAGTESLLSERDPAANVTILSGDIGISSDASDNSYHVVTGGNTSNTAILDGFTVTAGNAKNNASYYDNYGGGMFNSGSSPSLMNLIFSGNTANYYGGGMINLSGSNPKLTNVIFSANTTPDGSGAGGGMTNFDSSPILTNVTFAGNTGGYAGGGLFNIQSSPTLVNVTFNGNTASSGGGMFNLAASNANLTNVTFSGNTAGGGGGMFNQSSAPNLTNVTFSGNTGTYGGGGMFNHNSSSPLIKDSIFWDSGTTEIYNNSSTAVIEDSIVAGGCPAGSTCTNVINANPHLEALANNGGFTQTMAPIVGSPAINTGNNATCAATDQRGVARPFGMNCDMGAYEAEFESSLLIDQTISVVIGAPPRGMTGEIFTVSAIASSGLPVSYSASGACTNVDETFTITDAEGICTVEYDQSGDTTYFPAPQMTEVVANDAPVITEYASFVVTMSQNGFPKPFVLTLSATDADSDPLTWSIASPAGHGTATVTSSIADSKVIGYVPTMDYTGPDSFDVRVSDGDLVDTITVNVIIQDVLACTNSCVQIQANSIASCNASLDPAAICGGDPACEAEITAARDSCIADANTAYSACTASCVVPTGVGQTITVITHVPPSAGMGEVFTVEATASSGLPVSYSASGDCTNVDATFTIITGTGTCTVHYDQAGNANYNPVQVIETVSAQWGVSSATIRVSVDSDGNQANEGSYNPAVSADGRFVAFRSTATNLVPNDTNGAADTFVFDSQTGVTERVTVDSSGNQADHGSYGSYTAPAISADGRFVTFSTDASNLVPSDTNGAFDVFVRDRQSGTTERISVDGSGNQANFSSFNSALSADGRYVAFSSYASNLVPGDTNGAYDIFVHDRQTGTTERVSVDSSGNQGNNSSIIQFPAISPDGRFVIFSSYATNLVPGDTNATWDVFLHDRQNGTTVRVNVDSAGQQANDSSYSASVNEDGNFVVFSSTADNLVPGDTNGQGDIFVHNIQNGTTERISVDSSGIEANGYSDGPRISADGRYVSFYSEASNLIPNDSNGSSNIFVHDRQTGQIERVNIGSNGIQSNSFYTYESDMSADGRFVVFSTPSNNLVPNDTNGAYDVFVRDRQASPTSVDQTITVTIHAPASALMGDVFTVAATASSGLPVSYSSSGSCTNVGADFTMTSGIGTCTVMYDQAGDSNYNPAPQVTEIVNAEKAPLTITANDQSKVYGDPDPAFTFTYFGFEPGDTSADIDTPPACAVAGPHTDIDTYPIVCSGGVDDNYNFNYVDGTLTVLSNVPDLLTPANSEQLLNNQPTFDWTDVSGALSYTIQISNNIGFTGSPTSNTVTDSTYTQPTNLPNNVTRYWRVQAIRAGGPGSWSEIRSFVTARPPSAPGLASPGNNALVTDYSPLLDWNNSTVPAGTTFQKYELQIATDSVFTSTTSVDVSGLVTNSDYTPSADLDSNTTYYWRVRAFNTLGQYSDWSNVRIFRTALLPPTLVTPVEAEQMLVNRPTFEWDDVPGADDYRIQISNNAGFTSTLTNATVTSSTYTRTTDLPFGATLYWRVRSDGTNGPSAWSEVRSLITTNPPDVPTLALPANNAKVSGPSPLFDWNDSTLPVGVDFDHYQIQVAADNGFANVVHDNNVAGITNSQDNGAVLSPVTTYYWRVRAFNTLGHASAWSTVRSVRIKFAGPTLTSPSDGVIVSDLIPTFTWDSVSGATNYTIQVSKNSTFSPLVFSKTATSPTYTHTANLQAGTTYYWRVRVRGPNTYGPGDWSEVFTFTTP